MTIQCNGPNCDRPAVAKGLCNSHWAQQKRKGTLTPIVTSETPEERFLRNIEIDSNDCWLWQGSGSGVGYKYGQLRIKGKTTMAHRWAYSFYNKVTLTDDDTLDHLCRVTRCCNPAHLEIVGRSENAKRRHLYAQLRSENIRYRAFIKSLGHDPDKVLEGSSHSNIHAVRRLRRKRSRSG